MIETDVRVVPQKFVTAIVCDCCKRRIEADDVMRFQEVQSFKFSGGYASAFGDGNYFECDLCDECCLKLFQPYMRQLFVGGEPPMGEGNTKEGLG